MPSLTIRNIPLQLLEQLRALSQKDRRSLNNEVIVAIENGVADLERTPASPEPRVSLEQQLIMVSEVGGKWQDSRSTRQIVSDIRKSRTPGREVRL